MKFVGFHPGSALPLASHDRTDMERMRLADLNERWWNCGRGLPPIVQGQEHPVCKENLRRLRAEDAEIAFTRW